MIINVTREDINNGYRRTCSRCPVALSVRRINPKLGISGAVIFIKNDDEYLAQLPKKVIKFISAFDDFSPVKPFSFHLSAECFMV